MSGGLGGFTLAAARVVLGVESEAYRAELAAAEADFSAAIGSMGARSAELAERQLKASGAADAYARSLAEYGPATAEARAALATLVGEHRRLQEVQERGVLSNSTFEKSLSRVGNGGHILGGAMSLATNALIGGAGFVYAIHSAVSASSKFQGEMTLIQTQALKSHAEVEKMTTAILKMAPALATSPDDLAKGLYHIESAGYAGAKALDVLTTAAKGARLGHANLEDTTNALVAAQKSGIAGAHNLTHAMGELDAIVGAGNLRMEDLAKALSSGVLSAAAGAGTSLAQLGGALDTLTIQGTPAELAATRLRYSIALLSAQTPKATKELYSIGIASTQLGNVLRNQGIVPALELIHTKMKQYGLDLGEQQQLLERAFGGGRSYTTILTLYRNISQVQERTKLIEEQGIHFGDRWQAQTRTAEYAFKQLGVEADVLKIRIGNALLAPSVDAVKGITGWLGQTKNQERILRDVEQAFGDAKKAADEFGHILGDLGQVLSFTDGILGGSGKSLKLFAEALLLLKLRSFAGSVQKNLLEPLKRVPTDAKAAQTALSELNNQKPIRPFAFNIGGQGSTSLTSTTQKTVASVTTSLTNLSDADQTAAKLAQDASTARITAVQAESDAVVTALNLEISAFGRLAGMASQPTGIYGKTDIGKWGTVDPNNPWSGAVTLVPPSYKMADLAAASRAKAAASPTPGQFNTWLGGSNPNPLDLLAIAAAAGRSGYGPELNTYTRGQVLGTPGRQLTPSEVRDLIAPSGAPPAALVESGIFMSRDPNASFVRGPRVRPNPPAYSRFPTMATAPTAAQEQAALVDAEKKAAVRRELLQGAIGTYTSADEITPAMVLSAARYLHANLDAQGTGGLYEQLRQAFARPYGTEEYISAKGNPLVRSASQAQFLPAGAGYADTPYRNAAGELVTRSNVPFGAAARQAMMSEYDPLGALQTRSDAAPAVRQHIKNRVDRALQNVQTQIDTATADLMSLPLGPKAAARDVSAANRLQTKLDQLNVQKTDLLQQQSELTTRGPYTRGLLEPADVEAGLRKADSNLARQTKVWQQSLSDQEKAIQQFVTTQTRPVSKNPESPSTTEQAALTRYYQRMGQRLGLIPDEATNTPRALALERQITRLGAGAGNKLEVERLQSALSAERERATEGAKVQAGLDAQLLHEQMQASYSALPAHDQRAYWLDEMQKARTGLRNVRGIAPGQQPIFGDQAGAAQWDAAAASLGLNPSQLRQLGSSGMRPKYAQGAVNFYETLASQLGVTPAEAKTFYNQYQALGPRPTATPGTATKNTPGFGRPGLTQDLGARSVADLTGLQLEGLSAEAIKTHVAVRQYIEDNGVRPVEDAQKYFSDLAASLNKANLKVQVTNRQGVSSNESITAKLAQNLYEQNVIPGNRSAESRNYSSVERTVRAIQASPRITVPGPVTDAQLNQVIEQLGAQGLISTSDQVAHLDSYYPLAEQIAGADRGGPNRYSAPTAGELQRRLQIPRAQAERLIQQLRDRGVIQDRYTTGAGRGQTAAEIAQSRGVSVEQAQAALDRLVAQGRVGVSSEVVPISQRPYGPAVDNPLRRMQERSSQLPLIPPDRAKSTYEQPSIQEQVAGMTLTQLRAKASELNIPGRSGMTADALRTSIVNKVIGPTMDEQLSNPERGASPVYEQVAGMTVAQLRARASELGIPGRSSMTADALRASIVEKGGVVGYKLDPLSPSRPRFQGGQTRGLLGGYRSDVQATLTPGETILPQIYSLRRPGGQSGVINVSGRVQAVPAEGFQSFTEAQMEKVKQFIADNGAPPPDNKLGQIQAGTGAPMVEGGGVAEFVARNGLFGQYNLGGAQYWKQLREHLNVSQEEAKGLYEQFNEMTKAAQGAGDFVPPNSADNEAYFEKLGKAMAVTGDELGSVTRAGGEVVPMTEVLARSSRLLGSQFGVTSEEARQAVTQFESMKVATEEASKAGLDYQMSQARSTGEQTAVVQQAKDELKTAQDTLKVRQNVLRLQEKVNPGGLSANQAYKLGVAPAQMDALEKDVAERTAVAERLGLELERSQAYAEQGIRQMGTTVQRLADTRASIARNSPAPGQSGNAYAVQRMQAGLAGLGISLAGSTPTDPLLLEQRQLQEQFAASTNEVNALRTSLKQLREGSETAALAAKQLVAAEKTQFAVAEQLVAVNEKVALAQFRARYVAGGFGRVASAGGQTPAFNPVTGEPLAPSTPTGQLSLTGTGYISSEADRAAMNWTDVQKEGETAGLVNKEIEALMTTEQLRAKRMAEVSTPLEETLIRTLNLETGAYDELTVAIDKNGESQAAVAKQQADRLLAGGAAGQIDLLGPTAWQQANPEAALNQGAAAPPQLRSIFVNPSGAVEPTPSQGQLSLLSGEYPAGYGSGTVTVGYRPALSGGQTRIQQLISKFTGGLVGTGTPETTYLTGVKQMDEKAALAGESYGQLSTDVKGLATKTREFAGRMGTMMGGLIPGGKGGGGGFLAEHSFGAGLGLSLFGSQIPGVLGINGQAGAGLGSVLGDAGTGLIFGSMLGIKNPWLSLAAGASFGVKKAIGGAPMTARGNISQVLSAGAKGAAFGAIAAAMIPAGPLDVITVPVGAAIGGIGAMGLSLIHIKQKADAATNPLNIAADRLAQLGNQANAAAGKIAAAKTNIFQGNVQLANDKVARDQAKNQLAAAKAAEVNARGTKGYAAAVDQARAAQWQYDAAVKQVGQDEHYLTVMHREAKTGLIQLTDAQKGQMKVFQGVRDAVEKDNEEYKKLSGHYLSASQQAKDYASRMDDLAKKNKAAHPFLAQTATDLANIARKANHMPKSEVVTVTLKFGVDQNSKASLNSYIDALYAQLTELENGPQNKKTKAEEKKLKADIVTWGNVLKTGLGPVGKTVFDPKLTVDPNAGTDVLKYSIANGPKYINGKLNPGWVKLNGHGGGKLPPGDIHYSNPGDSSYLRHVDTQISYAQAKGQTGQVTKLENAKLVWLWKDYAAARGDFQKKAVTDMINTVKSSLNTGAGSALTTAKAGIPSQAIQDEVNAAKQSGSTVALLKAYHDEATWLHNYLGKHTSGPLHKKANDLLSSIDGRIATLNKKLDGGLPPKLHDALQKELQAIARNPSGSTKIDKAALKKRETFLEGFLHEKGHSKKDRSTARKQLHEVQHELKSGKLVDVYAPAIATYNKIAAYFNRQYNNKKLDLVTREHDQELATKALQSAARLQKKDLGTVAGLSQFGPGYVKLDTAYQKALQTTNTKTDDIKALTAEQTYLKNFLTHPHSQALQHAANKLLASIDIKLGRLHVTMNKQLQAQEALFLQEQQNILSQYADNVYSPGSNSGGTSVTVHNHFPSGPTPGFGREAAYIGHAIKSRMDG